MTLLFISTLNYTLNILKAMTNLCCLPADIISQIVSCNIRNASISINQWKKLLPLLAISRSWRFAAKESLYRYAIIYIDKDTVDTLASIKLQTNVDLIRDNSCCYMARDLLLSIYTTSNKGSISLTLLLEAFSIKANVSKAKVARALADLLPNVSKITMAPGKSWGKLQPLFAELADCYCRQMTRLYYEGAVDFSKLFYAPRLVSLFLELCDYKKNLLATINPRHLKDVHIVSSRHAFTWDYFWIDKSTQAIVFDNLESLTLTGEPTHYNANADDMLKSKAALMFPKLLSLSLYHTLFDIDSVKPLFQSSLKRLKFTGKVNLAKKICQQNIASLRILTLSTKLDARVESAQNYVTWTNEIFHTTKGIKVVEYNIVLCGNCLDFSLINWPFLTHLCLRADLDIAVILQNISAMPRLIRLEFIPNLFDAENMKLMAEYLLNLKTHFAEPSTSNIAVFIIRCRFEEITSEFKKAIQELNWYLPKLKVIQIHV